jgi:hypothetical protein
MKRSVNFIVVVFLAGLLTSCQKTESENVIRGTWISEDKADTLFVIDDHLFNKSLHDGILHAFDYSLQDDSIVIQYKRPNKIMVIATSHFYTLHNRELMIDFSNGCYGFEAKKEIYIKQKRLNSSSD